MVARGSRPRVVVEAARRGGLSAFRLVRVERYLEIGSG
jgi:hypothetical protein